MRHTSPEVDLDRAALEKDYCCGKYRPGGLPDIACTKRHKPTGKDLADVGHKDDSVAVADSEATACWRRQYGFLREPMP